VTADQLRQAFLRFFEEREHRVIPSSSLVPHKDPTLLLTSAGMVQIKPYYLGLETPPAQRMASSQKCFRTTDIDLVGDSKHFTFFEMLGNFSVADYFKKETISWAWEFVIEHLKLSRERLWITIYLDDEAAFAYWRGIGIPADRILRFGEEDNFWGPVGDSGPCGPCSEIHYDMGEQFGCGKPDCKPSCDCGRFCEIWNLVFTEFNQAPDGKRTPLPEKHIDTGMGLERTLAVLQGKPTPYETDLFAPLIGEVCRLSGREYGRDEEMDRAIRIVTDHSRGIAFLVADGVMPSSEGRGYILRRIIRRASLFGRKLGLTEPFLIDTAGAVIDAFSHVYPELSTNQGLIRDVIMAEEERFIATLDSGLGLVEKAVAGALQQGRKELTDGEAFRLQDTHGIPADVTAEIAAEKGLSVDWEGFEAEMEKHREKARAKANLRTKESLAGKSITHTRASLELAKDAGRTEFVGYERISGRARLVGLTANDEKAEGAVQGEEVCIVLDETPFYGEMGGQVGDCGEIGGPEGKITVSNTLMAPSGVIVHVGKVSQGIISVGDQVEAMIDAERRLDIARNHTATHLLQTALRKTLGSSVRQKGSLVEPERLRFDFAHMGSVTEEQLNDIQRQVNELIRQNLKVEAIFLPHDQAIAEGAIALFEEKYGEDVRVLQIGEPTISKELCGGTHVGSTGEIGLFLITAESSIGVGLHRIEAVTGRGSESLVESRLAELKSIAGAVEGSLDEAPGKVKALVEELDTERKRALSLERELSRRVADDLSGRAEQVDGVTVLAARVPTMAMPVLRQMGDMLKDRLKSAVVVLAMVHNGKPSFLAMVTPDLAARGFHAGDIVNQVAKATGGGGGGKAAMAQAGGKEAGRIDEALRLVKGIVAARASE